MSQYTRKDPPWSHVGVAGGGLNQSLMQQNQSLLGAQPGVVGTPTTNVYGQSMVSNAGLAAAAGATTAYPTPQQTMQQRQNMALQQQAAAQNAAAAAAAAGSQGGGTPQLTVSYPTTRATQGTQPRQRVFTGTVTKLHDTFGFVDEDVFFQTNTVKGSMPKIGERVLVEATYNASMPFKWNATRIQLLNNSLEQQVAQQTGQPQQHHAAMKMQQLKHMQQQQQQQSSRMDNVSQQFKMLKQSQQPLLKAPQAGSMMSSHNQPPPPGLLGNPPASLLQQPPPGVVQQPGLMQGSSQSMQNMSGYGGHQSRTSQMSQQSMSRRDFNSSSGSSSSRDRDRETRDRERERDRAQRERDRERDREHRDRERERERERRERERAREREKSPVTKRSRSPMRSRSPRRSKSPRRSPRRTKRVIQRYCVQIPRFALDIPKSDVIELHKRYMNMYIPSDFFNADFAWQDVFPIHRQMSVAQPCTFHVMHKEAPPPQGAATTIDPSDADYSFSAKVMLMSSVSQDELYEKCCARAQDSSDVRENFQHPTRLINFLVGQKGKNEVMAIGGPWSPSLDGADPLNDTSVLIKTAIRTTKALTGIDLTSCTQWYRFLELSYHRPEETHKGRVIPARVETVVIFVPDVWHILPTKVEWENLTDLYKKTLSSKLAAVDNRDKKSDETPAAPPAAVATTQEEPAPKEEEEEEPKEPEPLTPTNWKDLDPKNMKVNELRQELEVRGLNSKGLKSQLIARLTKTLKTEQETEEAEPAAMETDAAQEDAKEKEEAKEDSKEEEEKAEKEKEKEKKEKEEREKKEKEEEKRKEFIEEEKRRQRDREKRDLETHYTMPDSPTVMVHPSPIAKSGKFDCTVQSLSVLLDYIVADNKEHSFEVFLFAEIFNEMLQRDFAFNIYKALQRAPEKKEEKKEKDEKKKDKDKKEDKEKKEEKKDDKKDDKKEEKEEKKEDKKDDEPKSKRRKTDDKEADKEDSKEKDEEKKEEDTKEEKDGEDEEMESKSNEDDADEAGGDDKKKTEKKSKDEKKVRVKMETFDPHLLLSCIYFDQNHCGYILERDLEEILYTVGVHLSRAQVRKLLWKVITRDCWNYRKLTDGPKKEKEDQPNGEIALVPSDADLAKGNQPIRESASTKKGSKSVAADGVTMVKYGGSVIDIANLLKQVEKADLERSSAEKKMEALEKEIESLRNKASSSEATVSNVSGALLDVQKKLSASERNLIGSSSRSKRLIDVIGSAQKNLDEIMLKFNEVLEEAMMPPATGKSVSEKVVEKVTEKVKEEPKVKTEPKPVVKVEAKSPKGEKS